VAAGEEVAYFDLEMTVERRTAEAA
jgi:hypothetical protein